MKINLLCAVGLLCSNLLLAQSKDLVFIGSLSVKGSKGYPYKLQFKDSAGSIKGYSVTDIMGPDQTKSAITGAIYADKKEMIFRETRIIDTRSTIARDSFCYIYARLKLVNIKGVKSLKGHFTGYRLDGVTLCGKGDIVLFSAADVLDRLMKIVPKHDTLMGDTVITLIDKMVTSKKKEPTTILSLTDTTAIIQLSHGKTFNAICDEKTVTLQLWDDKDIDGDVVSILLNDKKILEKYSLKAERKQLNITLTGQTEDTIALIAISEGSIPPNTARLTVRSGNAFYPINASTKLNEPVYIILKHKGR